MFLHQRKPLAEVVLKLGAIAAVRELVESSQICDFYLRGSTLILIHSVLSSSRPFNSSPLTRLRIDFRKLRVTCLLTNVHRALLIHMRLAERPLIVGNVFNLLKCKGTLSCWISKRTFPYPWFADRRWSLMRSHQSRKAIMSPLNGEFSSSLQTLGLICHAWGQKGV